MSWFDVPTTPACPCDVPKTPGVVLKPGKVVGPTKVEMPVTPAAARPASGFGPGPGGFMPEMPTTPLSRPLSHMPWTPTLLKDLPVTPLPSYPKPTTPCLRVDHPMTPGKSFDAPTTPADIVRGNEASGSSPIWP